MSGQRRLAALKRLGAKRIPILLLTQSTKYDLEDAKAASVVENLHRNKMNTKDDCSMCFFERIHRKIKVIGNIFSDSIKKYLGFAAGPEKLKQFVPKEMSRDDCVKLSGSSKYGKGSKKDYRENHFIGSET